MKNIELLEEMFDFYGVPSVDWMGFPVREICPGLYDITLHHIDEARNGGLRRPENLAMLTNEAHIKLHIIEKYDKPLYEEYRYWFRIINDMMCSPTEEVMENIYKLKERLDKTDPYYKKGKRK